MPDQNYLSRDGDLRWRWDARNADAPMFVCAAACVAIVAMLFFDAMPDMPPGTTFDEEKKGYFVLSGDHDFRHPTLMVSLVRMAAWFMPPPDLQAAVALGRQAAAVFGGLFVFATILFARTVLPNSAALAAGILTACAPLTVLQAQSFKEDVFLAPWLMLSLLSLTRLLIHPSLFQATLFGILCGLSVSTKYIGITALLFGCFWLAVAARKAGYHRNLLVPATLTTFTFCVVNIIPTLSVTKLWTGLSIEIDHSLTGHYTYLPGWYTWLLHTWTYSLEPGLGPVAAWASVAAALFVVVRWRNMPLPVKVASTFGCVWYLLHELSPMKTAITGRHMVPLAGILSIVLVFALRRIAQRMRLDRLGIVALLSTLLALPGATQALTIARHDDTAIIAERVMEHVRGTVAWPYLGSFATRRHDLVFRFRHDDLDQAGLDFVIVQEPLLEQLLDAACLPNQPQLTRTWIARASDLARRPHLRIAGSGPPISYRNIPLIVVALTNTDGVFSDALSAATQWQDVSLSLRPEGLRISECKPH